MNSHLLSLRPLIDQDIPFAMELKNLAGWNQTEADWQGYLDFEPDGCFLIEASGDKAGTVTTITYGQRFGWVGMVLVHPSKRRLGIGTELLQAAIQSLHNKSVECIKLDAIRRSSIQIST